MKRIIYIGAFTFLGLLMSTLIHAGLEMPALWLMTGDPEAYGESWLWQNWELVHRVGSITLWVLGGVLGFYLGVKYWRILYIEKRRA